ncbi:MAG: imidazole glycerol phosphate synthase subunit HisH [Anaerolineales bacterium]|nr:imidazole glycerol phosphate synthase subunit HisH [Anaerolineales bacterium]
MIAIVDYGAGNLHSVNKGIQFVGGDCQVTKDPKVILAADKVILPGVGAFGDGMTNLEKSGLIPALKQFVSSGKPFLGICLGMQLLFERSEELGNHNGLGFLKGKVIRFTQPGITIPQIGWNQLNIHQSTPLLADVPEGGYVYFNHSYYCKSTSQENILATTSYGLDFPSIVGRENIFAVQFHPEKSQKHGLQILKNFVEMELT